MNEAGTKVVGFLVVIGTILVSMTLHELMHGVVAYKLGDRTAKEEGRLTLNPLKHLDPIYSVALPAILYLLGAPIFGGAKPVPVNSRNLKGGVWGMALVALAGPMTNLILAFGAFLLLWFLDLGAVGTMVAYYFMTVNLGFCCFNILPIPPLDGSRVLYAILPDKVREAFDGMEATMGVWLVYILLLVTGRAGSSVIGAMMNGVYQAFCWIIGG